MCYDYGMDYQFSPAAERAFLHAAGWSDGTGCTELTAPALLLGLLAEPECRAARILAEHDISIQTVRQSWPSLRKQPSAIGVANPSLCVSSAAVDRALHAAQKQAAALFPPVLETDHLLFGLLAGSDEVADWLKNHGLSLQALEADIQNRYQRQPPEEGFIEDVPLEPSFPLENPNFASGAEDGPAHSIPHPRSETPVSEREERMAVSSLPTAHYPLPTPFYRVLDAAANRGREGLRVVEDYVRFVLDDRHLTEQCKQLRHDLAAALQCLPQEYFIAARETQADVGTVLTAAAEEIRLDAAQLLTANFLRIQESLRSLEEFAKLNSIKPRPVVAVCGATTGRGFMAESFKQLRYRAYTLHRAVELTRGSIVRLATAQLYVLLDGRSTAEEFRTLAEQLIAAGVHVLQLRDKALDDRRLLDRAKLLRDLTAGTSTLFIMNDRPDLAVLSHADGVHVGQEEITVKDARSIVGPAALVGVSTHSIEQARRAVLDGANYIGVGPTFPSGTKTFDQFPGLELLETVALEIRLPAFAIGGITRDNLNAVLHTGFTRIAVREAVLATPDPAATAQQLLAALEGGC
jgi:thiamine-phosphate pyrophosphorylase